MSKCLKKQRENTRTDVGTNTGKDVPPAMQLEDERPRHTHSTLDGGQGATNHVVDIPDDESSDEDDLTYQLVEQLKGIRSELTRSPGTKLHHLIADSRIFDSGSNDCTSLEANDSDHDTWIHVISTYSMHENKTCCHTKQNGMHGDFIHIAMPSAEDCHECRDSDTSHDSRCWRFVESVDAVKDCGCGNEHGEVVT